MPSLRRRVCRKYTRKQSHDAPIADKILGRHYTRFLAFPGVKRPGVEKQHSILQWLTADVPTPSGREKFFCGRYCGSWASSRRRPNWVTDGRCVAESLTP